MYKLRNELIEQLVKFIDLNNFHGEEHDLTKLHNSFLRHLKINQLKTYDYLLTFSVQEKKFLYKNAGEIINSGCSACLGRIKIKKEFK